MMYLFMQTCVKSERRGKKNQTAKYIFVFEELIIALSVKYNC